MLLHKNVVCIGPSLSHGLVWPTTEVNETARIQCHEINEAFWTGLYVTRKCLDDGIWGNVDTSQCTIKSNRSSFIIYSTSLNMTDGSYSTSSQINTEVFYDEEFILILWTLVMIL